ncbi:hypothetical protein E2562_038896 [Oryza meyeriana var. granulata]|uniref:Uncharacterized protein n=1 Tax=Oryza meyeriana var. granulata TaxID=110450 RepID=A0A6G1CBU6_9ORYZ|nr:hypothetical protein E2562_038896 [Oryza meyeriana var. granulata]
MADEWWACLGFLSFGVSRSSSSSPSADGLTAHDCELDGSSADALHRLRPRRSKLRRRSYAA